MLATATPLRVLVGAHSVKSLASCAMTVLGSQGLLAAELVLDLPAVTAALPFYRKILIFIVDTVRVSMLPFIFFTVGGVTCLILVRTFFNRSVCFCTVLLIGRH